MNDIVRNIKKILIMNKDNKRRIFLLLLFIFPCLLFPKNSSIPYISSNIYFSPSLKGYVSYPSLSISKINSNQYVFGYEIIGGYKKIQIRLDLFYITDIIITPLESIMSSTSFLYNIGKSNIILSNLKHKYLINYDRPYLKKYLLFYKSYGIGYNRSFNFYVTNFNISLDCEMILYFINKNKIKEKRYFQQECDNVKKELLVDKSNILVTVDSGIKISYSTLPFQFKAGIKIFRMNTLSKPVNEIQIVNPFFLLGLKF